MKVRVHGDYLVEQQDGFTSTQLGTRKLEQLSSLWKLHIYIHPLRADPLVWLDLYDKWPSFVLVGSGKQSTDDLHKIGYVYKVCFVDM
jgi:hypothetical protein